VTVPQSWKGRRDGVRLPSEAPPGTGVTVPPRPPDAGVAARGRDPWVGDPGNSLGDSAIRSRDGLRQASSAAGVAYSAVMGDMLKLMLVPKEVSDGGEFSWE